jgi:hypothetical protein
MCRQASNAEVFPGATPDHHHRVAAHGQLTHPVALLFRDDSRRRRIPSAT